MKLHKDIEQKSEAWFSLRREFPLTASNATATNIENNLISLLLSFFYFFVLVHLPLLT